MYIRTCTHTYKIIHVCIYVCTYLLQLLFVCVFPCTFVHTCMLVAFLIVHVCVHFFTITVFPAFVPQEVQAMETAWQVGPVGKNDLRNKIGKKKLLVMDVDTEDHLKLASLFEVRVDFS